jgi:hypothetical protein
MFKVSLRNPLIGLLSVAAVGAGGVIAAGSAISSVAIGAVFNVAGQ